ncbi:MAG: ATP-grasp domain-containing protein, partial [Gemmataceae bacterium]|nr:ATP-grasp domain-containing protein [Gemmataceae bacterium]
VLPIAAAHRRFASQGTRLLVAADAATLSLLRNKATAYAALADATVPVPDHVVVRDLAEFDAAWHRLRPRHDLLCVKPVDSVYGIGFHVVADREPALTALGRRDPLYVSLDAARTMVAARRRTREWLLMEYLPGSEWSVDCLAQNGVLLRCVARRKEVGFQMIEEHPLLVEMVRRLTARFRLTHVFNVQFRERRGQPYLLEINPRMSGGLPMACQSGLLLPYWALRLALGTATAEEVPWPRAGIRIAQPEPMRSL